MKYILKIAIAALTLIGATIARSAPITYQGTIAPPVTTVTGSVGGFGFIDEVAVDVDFWRFMGVAGSLVSIRGTRLDPALDPSLDLYFGTTTADELLFRTGQSWGGLQYLVSADDDIDVAGPFGDPFISFFKLPATGNYTVAIGGFASTAAGPYPYSLSVQLVPVPATALLILAGVAGIGWTRRPLSMQ